MFKPWHQSLAKLVTLSMVVVGLCILPVRANDCVHPDPKWVSGQWSGSFEGLMQEKGTSMEQPETLGTVTPVYQPAGPPEGRMEKTKLTYVYTIYFALGQYSLDDTDIMLIYQIVRTAKSKSSIRITVSGHADTFGAEKLNLGISQRRVQSVSTVLMKSGIYRERICVEAFGEADLLIPTPDGTKEPSNRRVVIKLFHVF